MNWKYFVGAALVVGAALLKAGAPPLAIAMGILLAVVLNLRQRARENARSPRPAKPRDGKSSGPSVDDVLHRRIRAKTAVR